jgi:hypothetical protein
MLVCTGDNMAAGGVTRGTVILQAAASDLVERRDAAVNALRVLLGSTQQAFGQNDWPRGLEAYRRLLQAFDQAGQSDLRSLFNEQTLARTLDELIDLAAGNTPDGLRALGTAALVTIQRLQRLVAFAQAVSFAAPPPGGRRLIPESPPLASFLSALSLFIEAFDSAGGSLRLLYVARPPLIFYGLYGFGGPDTATRRLLNLVQLRGLIAEQVDCFMECDCDEVETQLMLDKVLYDVDRAIDLYCLGSDPLGQGDPERRAAAFGSLIVAFAQLTFGGSLADLRFLSLRDALAEFALELQWPNVIDPVRLPLAVDRIRVASLIHSELCLQRSSEENWARLVSNLAPACRRDLLEGEGPVRQLLNASLALIDGEMVLHGDAPFGPCPDFQVTIPPNLETSLDTIANDILANGL